MRTQGVACGFIVLVGLLLLGCAEKLTYNNWQTIRDGMYPDVVKATLGKPLQATDQTWVYYDEDKGVVATISFDQGKVNGKTWGSSEEGMQGKSPNVNQPGESERITIQKTK